MNTIIDRTGCPAVRHGTSWAYRHRGCRCPDAVDIMRRIWRGEGDRGTIPDQLNIDIALDRVRHGDSPPLLNVAERRAVIATLTTAGWTATHIALALGLARRSIQRHRTATAA